MEIVNRARKHIISTITRKIQQLIAKVWWTVGYYGFELVIQGLLVQFLVGSLSHLPLPPSGLLVNCEVTCHCSWCITAVAWRDSTGVRKLLTRGNIV